MRLLLDTHIWLWALEVPERLGPGILAQLSAAEVLFLSSASVWELAIKHSLGRISIHGGLPRLLEEAHAKLAARELRISHQHAVAAAALPLHHKDPFDRVLLAQAQHEGLVLVTVDKDLRPYGIPLLWAEEQAT